MLVPSADLVKRCTDDNNAKEYVEVVLRWTTTKSRFRFEFMDDGADSDLDGIEDEECESKTLGHALGK